MKEFMLYIRNEADASAKMPEETHRLFLASCRSYIEQLTKDGKLLAAQPIVRDGVIISGSDHEWKIIPYNERSEVNVGYYHILAKDMDEAIAIAKENPEFAFSATARIEVRPIKTQEISTGYVYPGENK